jgi:hypothetical protein
MPAWWPRCGEIDPLSGAVCNKPDLHRGEHADVDDDFEIHWSTS